jgi:predicted phage-related endonuclease
MSAAHIPLTKTDQRRCVQAFGRTPLTGAVPVLTRRHVGGERWLSTRRDGLGASEIAALLGEAPGAYGSPFSLWWRKYAGDERAPQTEAQHIGTEMEPLIAKLYAERHPDVVVCRPAAGLYAHPEHRHMLCTPDFLVYTGGVGVEPLECKSDEGGQGWGAPGTSEVPEHHAIQVIAQCVILGAERGHLVRLRAKRLTEYVLDVGADERALFDQWAAMAEQFLHAVVGGIAPDIDETEATTAALTYMHPAVDKGVEAPIMPTLAERYDRTYRELQQAVAAHDLERNRMRAAMGRAEFATHAITGERVAQRLRYKRAGYTVEPGEVDQLRHKNQPNGGQN